MTTQASQSGQDLRNSTGSPRLLPNITVVDPDHAFRGIILITVPHMDDEALACGGTIARLSNKHRIHLLYATDGAKAPEPLLPWIDRVSPDLSALRRKESVAAMTGLGVPECNLHFLNLQEHRLEKHREQLRSRIQELLTRIQPDHVLTPFRYDRHPDHIALNRVVTSVSCALHDVTLTEYFVYHHWRLLPRRDVRRYLHPDDMLQVDISGVAASKRKALECFTTQITCFYPWQSKPILSTPLLDETSREPEVFLQYNPSRPGSKVFRSWVAWTRLVHRCESPLKRYKDRAVALGRRMLTG